MGPSLILLTPAAAHEKRVARHGMMTVRAAQDGVEIDAMVVMRVGGERAVSVLSRYDLNRDGKLNAAEGALLADSVSPDVMGGLVLRQGKVALKPTAAEGRARRVERDLFEVAILVTWPARLEAGTAFSIRETVGHMGASQTAIQMQASALPPLSLRTARGLGRKGIVGPAVLSPESPAFVFTVRDARIAPGDGQRTQRTGLSPAP